jgi:hypothetical protein
MEGQRPCQKAQTPTTKKGKITVEQRRPIGENGHKSGQYRTDTKPGGHTMKVTRTKVFGRSIIIRRRKATKRALNYKQGEVFNSVHGGLWSLYWEHGKGRNIDISIDDR